MKKICSLMLVLAISLGLSSTTFAQTNLSASEVAEWGLTAEEAQALAMINYNLTPIRNVAFKQPLYNTQNEVVASMIYLSPVGYMIFDPVQNIVTEYSVESNHRYYTDRNADYVYGGALQYYEKEGGLIKDLKTQVAVSVDMMEELSVSPDFSAYKNNLAQTSACADMAETLARDTSIDYSIQQNAPGNSYYSYNDCYWYYDEEHLKYSTRKYNCNRSKNLSYFGYPEGTKGGVCGSVAVAILMAYYDDYRDDRYVPNNEDKSYGSYSVETYGCKLTKNLIPYIDKGTPGSVHIDWGMDNYLEDLNIDNYTSWNWFINNEGRIRYGARENRPTICGLNHPEYDNHWVVATGYKEYGYQKANGDLVTWNFYVEVNDGWGRDGVYIHINYVVSTYWLHNVS